MICSVFQAAFIFRQPEKQGLNMQYFKHLWLPAIILLFAWAIFPFSALFYLAIVLFCIWLADLAKRKKLKQFMLISISVILVLIGGYYFLAHHQMRDTQLNSQTLFLKACGDVSHDLPDFIACENGSCQIQHGTMQVPTRNNQQTTAQIVDKDWRFRQPVLWISLDGNDDVSRYCMK